MLRHYYRLLPLLGLVLALMLALPSAFAEELVLAIVLKEASQFHPDIIASQLQTQASRTLMLQADVLPNPLLTLSTIPTQRGNPYFRQADRVLRIDQTLERGGKRGLRKDIAAALIESTRLDEAGVRRQAFTETVKTLIALRRAQDRLMLAQQQEADAEKLAIAARFRVIKGDLSALESARIAADALRVRNDRLRASQALDEARLQLSRLLGADRARSLNWTVGESLGNLTPVLDDHPSIDNADAIATELPETRASLQRLEAAKRQRELSYTLRTRDVSVSSQLESKPDQGGTVIGVGISVPLLLGNDFRGDIARSEAEVRQAEAEWMSRLRQLQSEIRILQQSLPPLESTARSLLQDLLPAAIQNADKLDAAYRQGAASLIDLLDARRQAFIARNEAIDAQADLAIARQTLKFIQLQIKGELP